jgi:hypothetical protein
VTGRAPDPSDGLLSSCLRSRPSWTASRWLWCCEVYLLLACRCSIVPGENGYDAGLVVSSNSCGGADSDSACIPATEGCPTVRAGGPGLLAALAEGCLIQDSFSEAMEHANLGRGQRVENIVADSFDMTGGGGNEPV